MKKALALFLALVMCLSLVACGEKTQTIEITMDNWMDFFEIRPEIEWYQDDFGDTASLYYCHYFSVRPEYLDKIDLDSSKLAIGYTGVFYAVTYDVSWEEQKFNLGEVDRISEQMGQQTNSLENREYAALGDGKLFPLSNCELSKEYIHTEIDENGNEQNIVGLQCWTVDRIQGTIVVKGELLNLPASTLPDMPKWVEPEQEDTAIPEETTVPEPVYETVEITMDNWQEYFEFRHSDGQWIEDAFGDVTNYMGSNLFAVKKEYLDVVNPYTIDIAFSYSYSEEYRYCEADFENRTFAIGEIVPSEMIGGQYPKNGEGVSPAKAMTRTECGLWTYDCYKDNNMYMDVNGADMIRLYTSLDITRIQGTIEIQIN